MNVLGSGVGIRASFSFVLCENPFLLKTTRQTIGPIELKFHVKIPYAKLAKIYTKYFGHMTKMTAMPIYGKNSLKIFRTRRPVTLGLGM